MLDTNPASDHGSLREINRSPVQRVLVVANQTATSATLIRELRDRGDRGPVHFHLVVPALNSRLRHWLSDTDDAVSAAHRRGERALSVLKSFGLSSSVEVGDSVPLLAIGDALLQSHADEIVICTLPPDRSHWLEHNLVERTRREFQIPVWHLIAREDVGLAA